MMQRKLRGEASEARDPCRHIRIQACPAAGGLRPPVQVSDLQVPHCVRSHHFFRVFFSSHQNMESLCSDFLSRTQGGSPETVVGDTLGTKSLNTQTAC